MEQFKKGCVGSASSWVPLLLFTNTVGKLAQQINDQIHAIEKVVHLLLSFMSEVVLYDWT